MSWDVILIKTAMNCESMAEIGAENVVPFLPAAVISALKHRFPDINCESSEWLCYENNHFEIAFNLASENHIMLHIQIFDEEEGAVRDMISELCKLFDCRAFDTCAGEFLSGASV